nr:MAG TPA: hypothetical protein [Caudoviricetes sp.]
MIEAHGCCGHVRCSSGCKEGHGHAASVFYFFDSPFSPCVELLDNGLGKVHNGFYIVIEDYRHHIIGLCQSFPELFIMQDGYRFIDDPDGTFKVVLCRCSTIHYPEIINHVDDFIQRQFLHHECQPDLALDREEGIPVILTLHFALKEFFKRRFLRFNHFAILQKEWAGISPPIKSVEIINIVCVVKSAGAERY